MRIIITSDWHLDAVTAGVPRFDDLHDDVEQTVDNALSCSAAAYLFLGDLTDPDNPRTLRAVTYALDVAQRLECGDVSTCWLAGNHDVIEDGFNTSTVSPFATIACALTEPYVAEVGRVQRGVVTVVGLPFTARSHTYDPATELERLKREAEEQDRKIFSRNPVIVIGHLNIEGASVGSETTEMARGRDVFWPTDAVDDLFPNALKFNGHYHRAQNRDGIIIPGSLERLRLDEAEHEPGYLMVDL